MKRHKIWYKRKLFKKHFKSYQDWDKFNPPSGDKHQDRYKTDALQCRNTECPREGMLISEHEAFYYFAKQASVKILYKKTVAKITKKSKSKNSVYICPFCGGDDIGEI
ncbi:MAG: hypothetical protein U9N04_00220 [Patescibacteria group bacterium]|nr:hypothetical protein [Patescibacteria group bacterium]